jgi:hypothetical protein
MRLLNNGMNENETGIFMNETRVYYYGIEGLTVTIKTVHFFNSQLNNMKNKTGFFFMQ